MLIRHIKTRHILPVIIGTGFLLTGAAIYLTDRFQSPVYFISLLLKYYRFHPDLYGLFGPLGYNLPAIIHVFSFSLLTAGIAGKLSKRKSVVCCFWFVTDTIFELGQKYPDAASLFIPGWFKHIPFLDHTEAYFRYGTFDILDIAGYALGACAAYVCLMLLEKGAEK